MNKKTFVAALVLAAATLAAPLSAMAVRVQCVGMSALIYSYNSDGSVSGTRWVKEYYGCV